IREIPTEFWFVTQMLPAPTANHPGPVPAVTGMVASTVPSAGSIRTMASPRWSATQMLPFAAMASMGAASAPPSGITVASWPATCVGYGVGAAMVGDGVGSLAVGLEAPLSRLAEAGGVEPVGVL